MPKIIQQVPFPDGRIMYLTGFDPKQNTIKFHMSTNPRMLLEEGILEMDTEMVRTENYHFPTGYLLNFLEANNMLEYLMGS